MSQSEIKLFKYQVKKLQDLIENHNEVPFHKNVHVVKVDELKLRPFETKEKWDEKLVVTTPEQARGGEYPFWPGCVIAISKEVAEEGEVKVGQLVRFTPLNGEKFTTTDQKIDIISTDSIFVRSYGGNNILDGYEGEDDISDKERLIDAKKITSLESESPTTEK